MLNGPSLKKLALASVITVFALSPIAAWAFYKPVRVIAPQLGGVVCISPVLCIDDLSRLSQARELYDNALSAVERNVGTIQNTPRGIFCATEECSRHFGLHWTAAFNVGTFGFVIHTRGWEPHFVEHEMIHHLQNERLGSISNLFRPVWWREGMAYSLSRDPRRPIPARTLEEYRMKFEAWYKMIGHDSLWEAAEDL